MIRELEFPEGYEKAEIPRETLGISLHGSNAVRPAQPVTIFNTRFLPPQWGGTDVLRGSFWLLAASF